MDIEKWMEENFKQFVNAETCSEVLYFSIIWHIFEKEITRTEYSTQKALEKLKNTIDDSIVESFFINIKDYLNNKFNCIEYAYSTFKFRKKDITLNEFLKLYNSDLYEQKLEFFLWIAYRVRNNMFHGIKEIRDLDSQFKLFYNLNQLLMICIEINRKNYL